VNLVAMNRRNLGSSKSKAFRIAESPIVRFAGARQGLHDSGVDQVIVMEVSAFWDGAGVFLGSIRLPGLRGKPTADCYAPEVKKGPKRRHGRQLL
jgi:hypothetical protein